MGSAQRARDDDADGRLRPRRESRRRGDNHARPLPVTVRVVLYSAQGCHLCDRARATIDAVRADVEFELAEVDIGGDPALEARYRELLPVVEIDGRRAFVYHVPEARLRDALAAQSRGPEASL